MSQGHTPSPAMLKEVRGCLVARGTPLRAFCAQEGFCRSAVTKALGGTRTGPKSQALVSDFLARIQETA